MRHSFLLCAFFGLSLFIPWQVMAADLSISVPKEVVVGQEFEAIISVKGAIDVDTMRLIGSYPTDLLEWQSVSPGPVLSSLSPGNAFDQTRGAYSYGAFSLDQRLNGEGELAGLVFKVKKSGDPMLQLLSGTTLLSGGKNQALVLAKASLVAKTSTDASVKEQLSSFDLQSPSHSHEEQWYKDSQVVVTWKTDVPAVKQIAVSFDQRLDSRPSTVQKGTRAEFRADKDGIWYIHFGVTFNDGAYQQLNRRVLIDGTAPRVVTPMVDQSEVPSTVENALRFGTLDDGSGVKSYEVFIDGKKLVETPQSSYPLSGFEVGRHEVRVVATDYAGNQTSGETDFVITSLHSTQQASSSFSAVIPWIIFGLLLVLILLFFKMKSVKKKLGIK